jgi:hypothetical protein
MHEIFPEAHVIKEKKAGNLSVGSAVSTVSRLWSSHSQ